MNCMLQNTKDHPSKDSNQAQTTRHSQSLPADPEWIHSGVGHHGPEQGREAKGGEIMMSDVEVMGNGLRIPELAWRMLERQDQTGCKG